MINKLSPIIGLVPDKPKPPENNVTFDRKPVVNPVVYALRVSAYSNKDFFKFWSEYFKDRVSMVSSGTANWNYKCWTCIKEYFKFRSISPETMGDFARWFTQDRGLANSEYGRAKMELTRYIRWLKDKDVVQDPSKLISSLKTLPNIRKRPLRHLISLEEYTKLKTKCKGTPYYGVVVMVWTYGMRLGDALFMTWDMVDFDARVIRFTPWKTRNKTGAQVELPMPDEIIDLLQVLKSNPDNAKYVFNYFAKRGYSAVNNAAGTLRSLCQRAGIRTLNWHLFRHTRASRMLNGEHAVDVFTAQQVLGIKNLATLQRYVKSSPANKLRAINL